jgi:hypothetical protein
MLDLIAVILQRPSKNVLEEIGAQVPDMGIIVDGQSTGIKANLARFEGDKLAIFTSVCIEKSQCHLIRFSWLVF